MNCHTLMIDDWVLIDEPDKYAGCKARVQTLCNHQADDGFYLTVWIGGDKGYTNTEVFNEDLRPIELTPEILEKNGWYFDEIDGDFRGCNGKFYIYGRYYPYSIFDGVQINYVHELQHALRMAGVLEEIKL